MHSVSKTLMALTVACLFAVRAANAQHEAINKYLDSKTAAVAWIDISNIDWDQAYRSVLSASGTSSGAIDKTMSSQSYRTRRALLQTLARLGVERVYWLQESAMLVDRMPVMVIPNAKTGDVKEIAAGLMLGMNDTTMQTDGTTVLCGPKASIDEVLDCQGTVSTELTAQLNSMQSKNGIVLRTLPQMMTLIAQSEMVRKLVVDDPNMAARMTEVYVKTKTLGLEAEVPPTSARLTVRCENNATTQSFVKLWSEIVDRLAPELNQNLTFAAQDNIASMKSTSLDQTRDIVAGLSKLFYPSQDQQAANNFKKIGLALHNYESAYRRLPPQSLVDANGRRLLSWRVLILPFLGETQLYSEFHLDEAWDSPHNIKIAEKMPTVFGPSIVEQGPQKTRAVAPMAPGSVFGKPGEPAQFRNFTDGTSNTVWFVQADTSHAVVWTKPEDVLVEEAAPFANILDKTNPSSSIVCAIADGSIHTFTVAEIKDIFYKMITMSGGEVFEFPK